MALKTKIKPDQEKEFRVFIPFLKAEGGDVELDDEQRMVWGYASVVDVEDSQGDIMTMEALEEAVPEFMEFGNVRKMHRLEEAGVVRESKLDDKGWYVGVEVVDDDAWNKVKKGVYKGFSIGGKKLLAAGKIIATKISELSLVDRGTVPGSTFDMIKAHGLETCKDCGSIMAKAEPTLHSCVDQVKQKSPGVNPYAVCHASLGKAEGGQMDLTEVFKKAYDSYGRMSKNVAPDYMKKALHKTGELVKAMNDLPFDENMKMEEGGDGSKAEVVERLIEELQGEMQNMEYGPEGDPKNMEMSKTEMEKMDEAITSLKGKMISEPLMKKMEGLVGDIEKAEGSDPKLPASPETLEGDDISTGATAKAHGDEYMGRMAKMGDKIPKPMMEQMQHLMDDIEKALGSDPKLPASPATLEGDDPSTGDAVKAHGEEYMAKMAKMGKMIPAPLMEKMQHLLGEVEKAMDEPMTDEQKAEESKKAEEVKEKEEEMAKAAGFESMQKAVESSTPFKDMQKAHVEIQAKFAGWDDMKKALDEATEGLKELKAAFNAPARFGTPERGGVNLSGLGLTPEQMAPMQKAMDAYAKGDPSALATAAIAMSQGRA